MNLKKLRNKKYFNYYLIVLILLIIFGIMFLWNMKTPYLDDDFAFAGLSFNKIIRLGIHDYFYWNGRFFAQSFSRLILMAGIKRASIIAALLFVIMLSFILVLTRGITFIKADIIRSIFIILIVFLFSPGFATVYLWKTGVGNYLAPLTIDLLFLIIALNQSQKFSLILLSSILGFFAGWGNENTSGAVLLIIFLFLFRKSKQSHRLNLKLLFSTIFTTAGYSFLIFAPGNMVRAKTTPQWFRMSIIQRFINGFLKQMHFFSSQIAFIVFLSIVLSIIVLAIRYWRNNLYFWDGIIFIIGGFSAIIVMNISPQGMDTSRTYLGAFILLTIGIFKLIPLHLRNYNMQTIYYVSFVVLIMSSLVTVFNGIFASRDFNNQLNARYSYIVKNRNKRGVIKVKPLSYKYNRYSLSDIYFELTKNPQEFPNFVIEYGLHAKSVITDN